MLVTMLDRRGGWFVVSMLTLGCSTSVSTAVVENRVNEQRIPIDAASPRLQVSWQHGPDALVAQLSPQQCRHERAWVDSETRTTVRSPIRWLGPTAYGFATATSLLFALTYDRELDFKCDGQTVEPRPNVVYPSSCGFHEPDNTLPKVLAVSSLVFLTVGIVGSLQRTQYKSELLRETPQATSTTSACLTPRELSELVLVVRAPNAQLWPVQLSSDGRATLALTQTPQLPRGVDLKLVVYRAPHSKLAALQRGQVLATFQLPLPGDQPGAPPSQTPPPEPAPRPSTGSFQ